MTTTTASTGRLAAIPATSLLRFALRIDGGPSFLNGLAYAALAGVLDSALGLSITYLVVSGLVIMLYSATIWFCSGSDHLMAPAARIAVVINAAWAVHVVAFLLTGVYDPTMAGTIWLVAQAALVADFALLQAYAVRRA